jgi:glycosyltransferase involved in cell wall biosynthesis
MESVSPARGASTAPASFAKDLITSNPLDHEGGVVNYYRLFLARFKSNGIALVHMPFGSRMEHYYAPRRKRWLYPIYYGRDLLRFGRRLFSDRRIRVVQVSPSLILVPLVRDALIVLLARLLGRRVVVFFRGWKPDVVRALKNRALLRGAFRAVYGRADATIVLASRFKDDLVEMGWQGSLVAISTTMYEADAILPAADRRGERTRFIFLGRLSQLKGIGELIEAARLLDRRGVDFECLMVGHGDRKGVVEEYRSRVRSYGLEGHFRFAGRLTGRDKYQAYADSDVYVFPSWTEGCPTSVLEALGAGLFVISTDVGALKDIIREGENGRIVRTKDAEHLAKLMRWASENIEDIRRRRNGIQRDAEDRYEVAVVCRQFKKIYRDLIDGR